jgi:hypothetical protein
MAVDEEDDVDDGVDEPIRQPLFEVGVVEHKRGDAPWCIIGATLERNGTDLSVVLDHDRELGASSSSRYEVVTGRRLPLAKEPRANPHGPGHILDHRRPDGTIEELVIRPIIRADATWLSRYGYGAALDVVVLETLAAKRARLQMRERMVVLGFRGIAPHALSIEIGHGSDTRSWFLAGDTRWLPDWVALSKGSARLDHAARRVSEQPWMAAVMEAVEEDLDHLSKIERRYSQWTESGYERHAQFELHARKRHLLDADVPRLEVQPWAARHAVDRIRRPVDALDELLFLLYCSREDARVTPEVIGPHLTLLVAEAGRTVDEEQREYDDDPWSLDNLYEQSFDESGISYEPREELLGLQRIAELADGDFDLPVRELVERIHRYLSRDDQE